MKKFALILGVFLIFSISAKAEIYHGIDIDEVYKSSDWSSKEKIKEIIDDYTLILQYQEELDRCVEVLPDVLGCYDNVAEKIITNLYVYPEHNVNEYRQLKQALSDAYGLKDCRNKYAWPSGNICEIDRAADLSDALKKYIQDLIDFSKEKMLNSFIFLKEYKERS